MREDMKVAFEMRLTQMKPMDHIQKAHQIISDTPFNNDVIVKWRRIMKELVKKEQELIESGNIPEGLYPMMAFFPTGMFAYLFDLYKAKTYLSENNVKTIRLPVRELIRYIDQQQLDPIHRFEEEDEEAPIIVLQSPLFNQPFCISGNLKIADARKSGKGHLHVYYLLADEYLHLMHDDLSKAMHMYHMDLHYLSQTLRPNFNDLYISKVKEYLQ